MTSEFNSAADATDGRRSRSDVMGLDAQLSGQVGAVIEAIEADIIQGRILPRTRLIEDHLMEDYGAKRHVVRAALLELQRLGVVVKPRHRGAELRRFDRADLGHLYAMREVLHRAAVRAMPVPIGEDRLARVEAARSQHAAAAETRDPTAIHHANMAFHRALYALCDNPYLAESIRLHDWLSFPVRGYGIADPEALRQACREHAEMMSALRRADMVALEALCVAHMQTARDIYVRKFLT
jgi:DNA-binding GntR family transcriptional regulator